VTSRIVYRLTRPPIPASTIVHIDGGEEHLDDARWLADRGFGNPTLNAAAQAPGIGDFTISEL
jgi:hypothetical protein